MPAHQRRLRPDHDEVDLVRLAEGDHRRMVGDVERDAFGLLRDAGIARRAIELVGQRAGGDLPGQRVLAPAGAEKENVHARQALARRPAPAELAMPRTASTARLDARRAGVVCSRHESLWCVVGAVAAVWACAAPAMPGDYTLENRPEVVFKGGIVHQTPYPQGRRAASVWASDACWRDCTVELHLENGILRRARADPDACRPHLDACDRVLPAHLPRLSRRPAARLHRLSIALTLARHARCMSAQGTRRRR